ncbi:MAG: trxA [Mucilaginibacter sp.]|nr:trxA [Mucilaginibacter sp.]
MNKLLYLFLLSSLTGYSDKHQRGVNLASGQHLLKNDTTIIKTDVHIEKETSFYVVDEFNKSSPFLLDDKDHFKKLSFRAPVFLIESYQQIPFLINPGEQLILKVDKNGIPGLNIAGSEIRNNDLRFFVDYSKKVINSRLFKGKNSFGVYIKNTDFQDGIKKAQSDSGKRFTFLRNYQQSFKISPEFASYTHQFFKFLYIADVLRPLTYLNIDMNEMPIPYSRYVEKLKSEMICDNCLSNEGYRRAAVGMGNYVSRKFLNSNRKFSLSYGTISSSFTGATRRYILFALLNNNIASLPTDFENKLNAFINEETDAYSSALIERRDLISKNKTDATDKKELLGSHGRKYSWNEFLEENKGNIVYLDFWASWCVPCRKAFPDSRQLEKIFKDKKVRFVFISIDNNEASWKKAMLEEHIDSSRSYLLSDEKNSAISKRFAISSIPRYMIIDKNGVVVDDNTLNPFFSNVKKIITEHLSD